MQGSRIFMISLFVISACTAVFSEGISVESSVYIKALGIYLLFACLYYHLRIISRNGNTSIDYGINYSLSIGLFTGPLGLLIFEVIYRFCVYFYKKHTKTEDPDEFFHTFYNIGSFVMSNSIAFYLFHLLSPLFKGVPFGFWVVMLMLITVTSLLSDLFLITVFKLTGDIKTKVEAIDFIKTRSVLDMGKIAFTNGLLLLFLKEGKWEMLISLFILNYLVSRSFLSKSQMLQNKIERDKFEQMAYTDFLTGVFNRAYMDKKMTELNQSDESLGIVVADIDKFKRINDSYNHAVGDQAIRHFADTLKSYLSKDDYLFRSGGEEFTIIMRFRTYEECLNLAQKIRKGVENSPFQADFKEESISISYTASFGLFYYSVNDLLSIEKAYVYADQLLLQSKEMGKNRLSSREEPAYPHRPAEAVLTNA
ncbi:GGDEF domain-containing protein [Cytobacillus firmus]|uniref:GGDEF domain-containing protein n=1 Tax=Cytobacillus firmus TaxID=1399 RepID=UPI00158082FA|nr:GGDEF domain-containing protein [Cytobacillus firmus]MBG9657990.1 diguanylate cyclase [Cytobacillus firmus]MED1908834.1 GGDEF domain-containing protein [Cytobacillus firmus]NUH85705.1 GGDEF domain-containing protein [Cytobacillus firmus]